MRTNRVPRHVKLAIFRARTTAPSSQQESEQAHSLDNDTERPCNTQGYGTVRQSLFARPARDITAEVPPLCVTDTGPQTTPVPLAPLPPSPPPTSSELSLIDTLPLYLQHGSQNLGATCYLNALVMCLFHTPFVSELWEDHTEIGTALKLDVCQWKGIGHPLQLSATAAWVQSKLKSGGWQCANEVLQMILDSLKDTFKVKQGMRNVLLETMECQQCHRKKILSLPQDFSILDIQPTTNLDWRDMGQRVNPEVKCESGCVKCPKLRTCSVCRDLHTCPTCLALLRVKACNYCQVGCYKVGPATLFTKIKQLAPRLLVCNFRGISDQGKTMQSMAAPLTISDGYVLRSFTIHLGGHYVCVLVIYADEEDMEHNCVESTTENGQSEIWSVPHVQGAVLFDDSQARSLSIEELDRARKIAHLAFYQKM